MGESPIFVPGGLIPRGRFWKFLGGERVREKDVERKLKKRVESMGCKCLKFESPGFTGVPDRLILLPGGRVAFAELKAPGKKERPRQVWVQKELRDLGFTVFSTVDSDEKIAEVVKWCGHEAEKARIMTAVREGVSE